MRSVKTRSNVIKAKVFAIKEKEYLIRTFYQHKLFISRQSGTFLYQNNYEDILLQRTEANHVTIINTVSVRSKANI